MICLSGNQDLGHLVLLNSTMESVLPPWLLTYFLGLEFKGCERKLIAESFLFVEKLSQGLHGGGFSVREGRHSVNFNDSR